jgi:hypothetical protein
MRAALFLITCSLAAAAPLFAPVAPVRPAVAFPGWPKEFEGRTLKTLPLRDSEKKFEENFPGRIGRFTDGEREIVIRFIAEKTRELHPSSDCFKADGYDIEPRPIWVDAHNVWWGRFDATRASEKLHVYERIYDPSGQNWTDVSAWYWATLMKQTAGPWWSIVVAEKRERVTSNVERR